MFETIEMAPPDPILGLTDAYNADTNDEKINLGVGVYKDADGKTPILACVKAAERRLIEAESTKSYKPISGAPEYAAAVQKLLFGPDHEIISSKRAATAHCPGGTGALRAAGDYLHRMHPNAKLWLSNPTWANHKNIFAAAGVATSPYTYFDADANGLDFKGMITSLKTVEEGDVVLLHGCCHNPTGVDPTEEQWNEIAALLREQGALPLLDFAYQGFAEGLTEDAVGLRALAQEGAELFICSSFSKNFGLYNERVGALTIVAGTAEAANAAMSHAKAAIRANYSNPPAHGAAIVTTVLEDGELKDQWFGELTEMRDRINTMRSLFVETLNAKGAEKDFSFIKQQRGMFSFSGLTPDQVQALRDKYSIYIVGSGRINVAGMTKSNMDRLCEAIVSVL